MEKEGKATKNGAVKTAPFSIQEGGNLAQGTIANDDIGG
ncbi:hypothetical protein J2X05_002463 [Cellvibrio fibrivorans]|uniref:Uncharacterized protein n=1 Tax=Cellvibrio fibrivorans TaxID=126350 RepID=A0ABU1UZ14_9GAMM|nr:hypothetical protein [Cellvibrio fibrivorans]